MLDLLESSPSDIMVDEKVVSAIVAHLSTHFSDEESCMRVYEFPDLEEHILTHDLIRNHFIKVLTVDIPVVEQDLTELKAMIVGHIENEDEVFMSYLASQD
jgi:hemerythrin